MELEPSSFRENVTFVPLCVLVGGALSGLAVALCAPPVLMALAVVHDASARPVEPMRQSSRCQGHQLLSAQRFMSVAPKAAPLTRLKTVSSPPPAVLSPPSADYVAALRAELASIGQELARITPTLPSSLSPLFVLNWPRLPHAEMLAL